MRATAAAATCCSVLSGCSAAHAEAIQRQPTVTIGFAVTADGGSMDNQRWIKLMELGKRTGCHQDPERSFFIGNTQFPLCSRCTGVILGWIFSTVLIFFYQPSIVVILAFCTVMFLDWLLQAKGIIQNNNPRRLITGLMGGYALMSLYLKIIIFIVKLIFN